MTEFKEQCHFMLTPGRMTTSLIAFIHIIALGALSFMYFYLSSIIFYLMVGIVILFWLYNHRRFVLLEDRRSVSGIQLKSSGDWLVHTKNVVIPVTLLDNYYAGKAFVLLNFKKTSTKRYTALIMQDSIKVAQYRQLRVYLNTR